MFIIIDNTYQQKTLQFLPKLLDYFQHRHIDYIVIKGNAEGLKQLDKIRKTNKSIHGLILSGSPIMLPEVSHGASNMQQYITNIECIKTLSKSIPTLGICFGCQLMNLMFGGTLENVGGNRVICETLPIVTKEQCHKGLIPPSKAKFCCKYMPREVSKQFATIATVDINDKEYSCMVKHKRRPLYGCMFHPEALKSTHHVLDTFLTICRQRQVEFQKRI